MTAPTQKKVALVTEVPELQAAPPTEQPQHQRIKRRRSLDEMRSARDALVSGKAPQRDDEWGLILDDAIAEVIESRRILMDTTQRLAALHSDVTNSVKMMGQ